MLRTSGQSAFLLFKGRLNGRACQWQGSIFCNNIYDYEFNFIFRYLGRHVRIPDEQEFAPRSKGAPPFDCASRFSLEAKPKSFMLLEQDLMRCFTPKSLPLCQSFELLG
jgi:hypothetical protein